ncbi:MAG: response regulator [Candidatus Kerfeldbacteria bacterium CG08_land_8_20_14_0_20_42_7]|uniref:Response regulator n=1 Tax=Candidatus Kerfeldbacteria bacterium CG08_land_8_20_14_0_20_42_7 TaxID=2014245 RepID=A0A2H0YSK9_9BACT|nr:MAG: response regulator [Candidatus Kerfeldbacteria bacterium CG08_land_8_20_14_0_20_42_7]
MNTKVKILIIEDDKDQIFMYRFKFEKEGFAFFSARTGAEGIKTAKTEKPDLILLDLILINESGVDILEKLKADEAVKNIPVIILTNLAKKELKARAQELGIVDFIIKTQILPAELVARVKKALKI